MKKLMFVLLFLVVSTVGAEDWDITKMNHQIDQTNFIVGTGCSGTLISLQPALILTNYHCIQRNVSTVSRERPDESGAVVTKREIKLDPVPVRQVSYNGHETVGSSVFISEIVARQQNRDLAVLRLRAPTIPHQTVSTILPPGLSVVRGQPVWAVGNPAGLDATVTSGIISSVSRTFQFPWAQDEDLPMIQTDVGMFGGNSGGALYDHNGYLVGVPTAGHRQATHLGLAIPSSIVWEMLSNHCLAEHVGGVNSPECEKL